MHLPLFTFADVICSVVENSVTVNQSEGNITVVIAISRKVETPFVCQIETQFISDGMCSLHALLMTLIYLAELSCEYDQHDR